MAWLRAHYQIGLYEDMKIISDRSSIEEQGAMIAQQQKQIETLTATVQKVSDQVALANLHRS